MNYITAKVVEDFSELSTVISIRDMVFIQEYGSSYKVERDGNDLAGTHLLAFVGEDPAAAMRIRWFSDGAKFEHLAVRTQYRRIGVAKEIAAAAIRLAKAKGFKKVWGYPVKEMVSFWEGFGWQPIEDQSSIEVYGLHCYPMSGSIEGTNDVITLSSSYEEVNRPENFYCQGRMVLEEKQRALAS